MRELCVQFVTTILKHRGIYHVNIHFAKIVYILTLTVTLKLRSRVWALIAHFAGITFQTLAQPTMLKNGSDLFLRIESLRNMSAVQIKNVAKLVYVIVRKRRRRIFVYIATRNFAPSAQNVTKRDLQRVNMR